ncbi:hypothetical protein FRC03_001772 [Tulasnella sp. 419]|nr:hypothetical protein FRC03_001772 [Tulasnella sp. 419]
MGPGRKLYHKPCLTCTSCSKRLDSLSLVEHNSEPYCKICHLRNFSTKDLRHANLPQAEPPKSPTSPTSAQASISTSPAKRDLQEYRSVEEDVTEEPSSASMGIPAPIQEEPEDLADARDVQFVEEMLSSTPPPGLEVEPTAISQSPQAPQRPGISIYSRRPLSPVYSPHTNTSYRPDASMYSASITRSMSPTRTGWRPSTARSQSPTVLDRSENPNPVLDKSDNPLSPTATEFSAPGFTKRIVPMSTGGTIVPIPHGESSYSAAKKITPSFTGNDHSSPTRLTPNMTGSSGHPKKVLPNFTGGSWSPNGGRIECPKCKKVVYHAEGVNAIGKRWHKSCLRCTECTTSLDSTRLTEKDGEPYCRACYSKLYGPRGAGYALLGRVG